MTDEQELGWLAGIMDGEGCFGIYHGYQPVCQLTNTSPLIINKIEEIYKKYNIQYGRYESKGIGRGKDNTKLAIWSRESLLNLIRLILPLLQSKQEQAIIAKKFINLRIARGRNPPGKQESELIERITVLNKRGI